jgi:hypothetical protein
MTQRKDSERTVKKLLRERARVGEGPIAPLALSEEASAMSLLRTASLNRFMFLSLCLGVWDLWCALECQRNLKGVREQQ